MADEQNIGAGAAGEGAAGAGSGNTGGQQNANGGGQQPVAGQQGQGAAEKVFTYKEDRTDWIPRHRLNETGQKLTAAEKRAQEAEAALNQERARVRALSGVEPQDPKQKEASEIRDAIYELVPELGALKGLTKEQLQEVLEAAQTARSSSQASWERHSLSMLGSLETEAAKTLGVEKLTDRQKNGIYRAYREEAVRTMHDRQVAMQRGERTSLETVPTDNDFVARHERGDQGLLKEFAKEFLNDWVEPARRSATAEAARRGMRPVPRGERSRLPLAQGAAKVNYNDKEEFKKAMLAARGGGQE